MTVDSKKGGARVCPSSPRALHGQAAQSSGDSEGCTEAEQEKKEQLRRLTPLERVAYEKLHDEKVIKEITLGKRIGFYQIRGEIGRGNFSQVKLGIHTLTKEKVAIKILDKTHLDDKFQHLITREIATMERLHHPNIIRLFEVIETRNRLHLAMEYAGGGELFATICTRGRLSENQSKQIFAQVVSAVKHMHEYEIIHRDLKAENIFFTSSYCVKVGDFGFSTLCCLDDPLKTLCGSPPYAAPELFQNKKYLGVFVDIWALGILLYFMLTATMPFNADTIIKLKQHILQGVYTFPPHVSVLARQLIQGILKPIPTDRFTITKIMNNPWLKGVEYPKPYPKFRLNPAHLANAVPMEEEKEVKAGLRDLGITEEHFMNNWCQDSQSPITGAYRIVVYRVQRKRYTEVVGLMAEPPIDHKGRNTRNERGRLNEQTTAFCVIF
ncbi:serine/threonine-protein kinase NIM1-like [Latimeria chalumnae]|uniref:Serine/threonine-protein kinase NIM1 n=1 Tax=Latimeria chalumnae TaxID=7897 RepID=H3BDB6_LATCH|nr:PREDICTED: serine/threonine-protein kinase NIM1-like [Latimeria chalumnae]|eukprot:XP_014340445.1 PREDICTED: serine/threonine-protein kinase NIM1-like [Latimeria chalumnae]